MSDSDSKFINEILNFKILIYKKGLLTKFQLIFNLQIDMSDHNSILIKNALYRYITQFSSKKWYCCESGPSRESITTVHKSKKRQRKKFK